MLRANQTCWAWACVAIVATWAGAAALAEGRFQESGFGVSFEPPAGWTRVDEPTDGSLALWVAPDGSTLNFHITEGESVDKAIETTDDLVNLLFVQLGYVASKPTLRSGETDETVKRRIADRPGAMMFFDLETAPPLAVQFNKQRRQNAPPPGRWFMGTALLRLDPTTVALWQLLSPIQHDQSAEQALRKLVDTVQLMAFEELNTWREERLVASQAFLSALDRAALAKASSGETWLRIIDGNTDVGFVHRRVVTDLAEVLREKLVPDVSEGGYMVVERTVLPPRAPGQSPVEHVFKTYVRDDGRGEVWTLKSTVYPPSQAQRDLLPTNAASRPSVWTQTGSRDDRDITVVSEAPPDADAIREITRAEQFRGERRRQPVTGRLTERFWVIPDPDAPADAPNQPNAQRMQVDLASVYLNQADLYTLPPHLPKDQPGEFAAYTFDIASETMALRTYTVTPLPNGQSRIDERPTSRRALTRSTYNAAGQLIEQRLPNGQQLVPVQRSEIQQIWQTP